MYLLVGYFCFLLSKDHNVSLPSVDMVVTRSVTPVGKAYVRESTLDSR